MGHEFTRPGLCGRPHSPLAVHRCGAVDEHAGNPAHTESMLCLNPRVRRGEQQTVDLALDQVGHDLGLDALVLAGVTDEQTLAALGRSLDQLEGVLGEIGIQAVTQDETEGLGASATQGTRAGVRQVAQLVHRVAHPRRRCLGHGSRSVVDDVADDGRAHAGQPCHVGARHSTRGELGGRGQVDARVVVLHVSSSRQTHGTELRHWC